ncbi:MAG: hypothetical protein ACRCWM_09175 [Sarcina sp.]
MVISDDLNTNILMSNELYIYRNLKDVVFPSKLSVEEGRAVSEKISEILLKNEFYKFKKVNLWEESKENLFLLLERGAISLKHYKNRDFATLLMSSDERFSVMINEENHITVVCRGIKTSCRELYNIAQNLLDDIFKVEKVAYNDRFGFLNATIDKLGMGLKACSILHLPLLNNAKMIKSVTSELDKVGIDFYDVFTTENEGVSNLYRLSNRVAVGVTAEEIFNDLDAMTYQVVIKETKERKYLKETDYEGICDNVFRAKAILESARKITYGEVLKLLSMVRLGIEVGLIDNISIPVINELFLITKYNHIKSLTNEKVNENKENILRATRVREWLEEFKV